MKISVYTANAIVLIEFTDFTLFISSRILNYCRIHHPPPNQTSVHIKKVHRWACLIVKDFYYLQKHNGAQEGLDFPYFVDLFRLDCHGHIQWSGREHRSRTGSVANLGCLRMFDNFVDFKNFNCVCSGNIYEICFYFYVFEIEENVHLHRHLNTLAFMKIYLSIPLPPKACK